MAFRKPPPPRSTPPPYSNGAEEPITGVFTPHTGRTREMAKWAAIIVAVGTVLSPLIDALARRIDPPPPQAAYVDPSLLEELRAIRDAHARDGGGR